MPTLGADMQAGTLIEWRKQPGDRVARGEIIAEVETDKGLIEIEVFTPGVIERLLVAPGEQVPVGTVLAIIREGAAGQPTTSAVVAPALAPVPAAAQPTPPAVESPATGPRVRASPAARARAAALGVDLGTVTGGGPGGVIEREDVERAAAGGGRSAGAAPAGAPTVTATAERQARMRQTIAAAMARSKREIPHYYLAQTIDMQRTVTWLADANARRPVTERLLTGILLIKAVGLALREVPELNGTWSEDGARVRPDVHVGVAIGLRQGGVVVPALHDVDHRTIDDLMQGFRDLVTRARRGSLRSSELSDATITVTSLGEQGVETVFGVIYPPQLAIVGFGKIVERPWAVESQVVVRSVVTATLAADHRVTDGHRGGLFLAAVDRLLQSPERL
jgi:pyruvate dehydrogenase E2 component (dihydrolipoamide acetyltransferase)